MGGIICVLWRDKTLGFGICGFSQWKKSLRMVLCEYFWWTYNCVLWFLGFLGLQDNMDLYMQVEWVTLSFLGCIFQRNSVGIPYILLLSCPTQQNYVTLCHQNTEKERQSNFVSTRSTADLHTYFLRGSAIKFTLLLKTTTTHQLSQMTQDVCLCEVCPAKGGGTQTEGEGVFV